MAMEPRDGFHVAFNNLIQVQTGGQANTTNATVLGTSTCGISTVQSDGGLYYSADGLNPLDLNAKANPSTGNWTDPVNGNVHSVDTLYNPPDFTDTTYDTLYTSPDHVVNGVDCNPGTTTPNPLYGDVFGTVSGGSLGTAIHPGTGESQQTLANVTVTGILPSTIPADYFRGFVVRNGDMSRGTRGNLTGNTSWAYPYSYITSSSAATSSDGNHSSAMTFILLNNNPCNGANPLSYNPLGTRMELRRIEQYFGISARGALPIPAGQTVAITPASNPMTYTDTGTPHFLQEVYNGSYSWDNLRRVGNGANSFQNDVNAPKSIYYWAYAFGDRMRRVQGQTTTLGTADQDTVAGGIRPTVTPGYITPCGGATPCSPIEPLFQRGYRWDPTVAAGTKGTDGIIGHGLNNTVSVDDDARPQTRVGPDWYTSITDPLTGIVIFSNDPTVTTGGPNGNGWPEAVTGYRSGAGGDTLPYPHPLITPPVAVSPTFTSSNSATFTAGVSGTFSVTVTGDAPMVITHSTFPAGTTGLVLTDNGDGSATLSWPSPVAGTYNFNLLASNGVLPNATQPFTLTVQTPISVHLDKPLNGQNYVAPATIPMQASIIGGTGTVTFYDGTTSLGTSSAVPAIFSYTNVTTIGTHDLHAQVGTTDSNHVNVTVAMTSPTPSPAQLTIRP
jgi:hypothetical protein